MATWSSEEQLGLINACNYALGQFPGASLRRLPAELRETIHSKFVELTGCASRTEEATLAAFHSLVRTFERARNSSEAPDTEAEANVDDRVLDAVAEFLQAHPLSTTGTNRKRRSARVTPMRPRREKWTPEELEVLARALADIGLSAECTSTQSIRSQVYPTYVVLGGGTRRSRSAVTQAAWRMLHARKFVLSLGACRGSWEAWLRLQVSRRRELVARMPYRFLLLRMNRAVFRALDEAFARGERDAAAATAPGLNEDNPDVPPEGSVGRDQDTSPGLNDDNSDTLSEASVGDAQHAFSREGEVEFSAGVAPLRQDPACTDENGAADACSVIADHNVSCLLQAALKLNDVAESILAKTVTSRAKELNNLFPTVLQALAGRDDQGCEDVAHIFLKQGEYLDGVTDLLNAQREGTARLLAEALSKGAPRVQEDRQ